jgi:murein DD-endopeptidase MepM/ murein hydrolase activator NlpD
MAFLSAVYQTYDLGMVQDALDDIFDELYDLDITEESDTTMETVYNEEICEYEEVEVTHTTLTLKLEVSDLGQILESRLPDDDARELYETYTETGGGHHVFYNPFTVDWKSCITSRFGWRIHPIYDESRFHYGVDIGMSSGTEIHACSSGTVTTAGEFDMVGKYIVIKDETGYMTHYEHLSEIDVSVGDEVRHGDVIGKVGSTGDSTGPHLHLGIQDADGNWLNPEFLVSTYSGGT